MLRKLLLPALAAATLAGCATGYGYRGGAGGDYYYGQPRVEYRYHDPNGYGGFGYGFGGYYYDAFGRLHYGNPYGYHGYPRGGHGGWWYRPRPHHGHGDHGDDDGHEHGDRNDRRPPWRNPGGTATRPQREDSNETRPRRPARSAVTPMPQREQRMTMPAPRMRGDGGGSRMGGAVRNAKSAPSAADE